MSDGGFPVYRKRKDRRNQDEKDRKVLPMDKKPKIPTPTSTEPEFSVIDDVVLDEITANSYTEGKKTILNFESDGGVHWEGEAHGPTLAEQEDIANRLEKYYKAGIGAVLAAESEKLSIITVRKYFRAKLESAKMALDKTWVEDQKNAKVEQLILFDRHILKFTFILDKIEKAINQWDKFEDAQMVKIELRNEDIRKKNDKLEDDVPKEPLEVRLRQFPYGLQNKQREVIKEIAQLQATKSILAMQPTAGESMDVYFKQEADKLVELNKSVEAKI